MSAGPFHSAPFRIEPVFFERIWGARSLEPIFPQKKNLDPQIGEAWLTGVDCRIATGPFAEKSLGEAWREMPGEWRGAWFSSGSDFPLLVKFIFPADKLSIQVHPDDAYASVHEKTAGGKGKTEMWHVVSAKPGARLLAGLKSCVSNAEFSKAIANHAVEPLLQSYEAHAGDTFFIPAGTPHTIGPGMIICEVQQYSDLTYRVYDYGRVDARGKPRELHIEKALQVIPFGQPCGGRVAQLALAARQGERKFLAACRYFAAERFDFEHPQTLRARAERFELLAVLSGAGQLHWDGGHAEYRTGECWFVPANVGSFDLLPAAPTSLVRAYVPDLALMHQQFESARRTNPDLPQVVFD